MTGFVSTEVDERRHVRAERSITVCGQPIWPVPPGAAWPACHVCLPREAHPMEPLWALCRRLDDRANVGAGEPR